ncbi:hypothetical protein [Deinococcus hohokamensis]|uniref:Knr4/Smi1-like domain-containing protein n=1 Tax=Deinococcus hohokamensis TaxID=309883 RepID=A0ABV9I6C0_9DEIO
MNENISKFQEAIKFVESYREACLSTSEIASFKDKLKRMGWKPVGKYGELVDILYGVKSIQIEGRDKIFFFDDGVLYDKAVPTAWKDKTSEIISPFGYSGMSLFYISETGYIYGDVRDGKAMDLYGYLDDDGLYNIIFQKPIDSRPFVFDENLYDDIYNPED